MTDKQLRHLSKADLIDIIYQMKQTEEELRDELAQTQEKLDKRELKIGEAGSIAEAVVGLSGVFEAPPAAWRRGAVHRRGGHTVGRDQSGHRGRRRRDAGAAHLLRQPRQQGRRAEL